jgi:hypothetical protein
VLSVGSSSLSIRCCAAPRVILLLIIAGGLSGCQSERQPARDVAVRRPLWTPETAWTVRAEPTLVLGTPNSVPEAQFQDVRGAIALSDGRIVVAEASADQLVVFGSDGRVITTIGRSGRGPGELRDPNDLFLLPRDTIAVRDLSTSRITLFTADGNVVDDWRIGGPPRSIAGVLRDHRLVAFADFPGLGTGLVQARPFSVLVLDFSGKELATVGPFEGRKSYNVDRGNLHIGIDYIFDYRTHVAAGWDSFVVGDSGSDSVIVYDLNGESSLVIQLPLEGRLVQREDVEAYLDRHAPASENRMDKIWRQAHLEMIEEVSIPEKLPRFADLRIDPDGNLWIQGYPEPEARSDNWYVFDIHGFWLGVVSLPGWLKRVLHVGRSCVVGLASGEYDIPLVQVYQLSKP